MRNGYLPIILKASIKSKYYDALDKAMLEHDYTDFIKLIVDEEDKIIDQYLKIIDR